MAIVQFDPLRSASGTGGIITNAYLPIGAVLAHPWRIFKITNNTNGDLLFSIDGTTDHMFVPANSFILYDLSTNAQPVKNLDSLVMGIKTQFYVKYSTVPSSGAVYIEAIFAKGE